MNHHRYQRPAVLLVALALVAAACGTRMPDEAFVKSAAGRSRPAAESSATEGPSASSARESDDNAGGVLGAGDNGSAIGDLTAPGRTVTSVAGGRSTAVGGGRTNAINGGQGAGGATRAQVAAGKSDPGVTDTEIRVGLDSPLSGFLGFAGNEIAGAVDSYFKMVNDSGGINGRKLKLIAYDDHGDQSQMLANLRRLYENDKVIAFIPFQAVGAEDYISRNRIPTLEIGVEPTAYSSKYPFIHPLAEHYLAFTQEMPVALKKQGVFKPGMRVAVLYDPAGNGPDLEYIKEAWTLQGANVVTMDPFGMSETDCTSLVLKMRQLNIDFWDFEGAVTWFFCISAGQRQQYKPKVGWGSYSTSLQFLVKQAGPWADKLYSGNLSDKIPDGAPRQAGAPHKQYYDALKRYHSDLANPAEASAPTTMAYWMVAKMLVEALKAQGKTITRDGINNYVLSLRNWDGGIAPPIKSMAADCKTGNGVAWFGQWDWNGGDPQLHPVVGYQESPYKDRYGGECYLTKIADKTTK